jgi:uridine kinase
MGDEKNQDVTAKIHQEITVIDTMVDFDDPRRVDFDLLRKGLRHLIEERQPFNKPVYDRYFKIRTAKTISVQPADVIIVEGALSLCDPALQKMYDLAVWIDTDDDVRLSRRVLKNEQREESVRTPLADLLTIYEEFTKPSFERYIEPTKKFANTIIPNYGFSTEKLNVEQMAIMGVDLVVTHVVN